MKKWIYEKGNYFIIVEAVPIGNRIGRVLYTKQYMNKSEMNKCYDLLLNNKKHLKLVRKVKRKGELINFSNKLYYKVRKKIKRRKKIRIKIRR